MLRSLHNNFVIFPSQSVFCIVLSFTEVLIDKTCQPLYWKHIFKQNLYINGNLSHQAHQQIFTHWLDLFYAFAISTVLEDCLKLITSTIKEWGLRGPFIGFQHVIKIILTKKWKISGNILHIYNRGHDSHSRGERGKLGHFLVFWS